MNELFPIRSTGGGSAFAREESNDMPTLDCGEPRTVYFDAEAFTRPEEFDDRLRREKAKLSAAEASALSRSQSKRKATLRRPRKKPPAVLRGTVCGVVYAAVDDRDVIQYVGSTLQRKFVTGGDDEARAQEAIFWRYPTGKRGADKVIPLAAVTMPYDKTSTESERIFRRLTVALRCMESLEIGQHEGLTNEQLVTSASTGDSMIHYAMLSVSRVEAERSRRLAVAFQRVIESVRREATVQYVERLEQILGRMSINADFEAASLLRLQQQGAKLVSSGAARRGGESSQTVARRRMLPYSY